MASVQKTIPFPSKKRLSLRTFKKVGGGKENNLDLPANNDIKVREETSPTKRLSNSEGLLENGASPPKLRKSGECGISESALCGIAKNLIASLTDESPGKITGTGNRPYKQILSTSPHKKEKRDAEPTGLVKAVRLLHSSQPTKLHGRDDKVEEITSLLVDALNKKESTTLYISGPPGTGKSACVNYIISQPQISGKFKSIYVNCTGLKTASAAYKRIAQGLGLKNESTDKKLQLSIEKYLRSNNKIILLVLDEMDQLESRKQSLLYTIFEWPTLFRSNLILIGIANALDLTDRVLPRLQAKLDIVPKLIHFPPYSREEIMNIITNRLKEGGVDSVLNGGALQLLASKVAAVSGDIRKALDIGRNVVEMAHNKPERSSEVALLDVLSVVNKVYGTSTTLDSSNNGESFPLHQKLLICVMILIKRNSKIKEVTIGRLHDVYRKVCTKKNINSLDMSEFLSLAELVESRGVLRIIGKTKNRLSKVVLMWDETEISIALQDKQLLATILDDISCLK